MDVRHGVRKLLAAADPDLVCAMLRSAVQALMSAEADERTAPRGRPRDELTATRPGLQKAPPGSPEPPPPGRPRGPLASRNWGHGCRKTWS
jgi:hypothetical protein